MAFRPPHFGLDRIADITCGLRFSDAGMAIKNAYLLLFY
jgi:hypothetical protein